MTPYLPCHDGFRVIPAHLIRELSRRHELHLFSFADTTEEADQLEWPRAYCYSVEVVRNGAARTITDRFARRTYCVAPEVVERIRARVRELKPDVLHLEGPAIAPFAQLVPSGAFVLLSAHDALSLRYREFAKYSQSYWLCTRYFAKALLARRFERRWYGTADRVVVTSNADLDSLVSSVDRKRIAVIPNGVDLDYWAYRPMPRPGRIVFTGNMSWPPNEDAAEYFAVDVLPLIQKSVPGVEFWIVGAVPSSRVLALAEISGIHVTGTVPDIREWIWTASVYVSPLRFGAGVKNKILEAMALGAPIVATPQSLTGTPLVHERHLLIAKRAPEIAEAVLRLLRDDALCRQLSKEARHQVEIRYSWGVIASQFEALYPGVGAKSIRPMTGRAAQNGRVG